ADQLLLDRKQRFDRRLAQLFGNIGLRHNGTPSFDRQLASGGLTPLKNSHEISSPTQITKPNRLTRYTAARLPMPSCQSFLKLERTPIEKNVRMKKITRNVLASPTAAGTLAATSLGVPKAR